MPVSLRVVIPSHGITKVLKFAEDDSIQEVCCNIVSKINITAGKDHGIFLPIANSDVCGKWARNDKTIEYYDLKNNDEVCYKKKIENLKIRFVDDSLKTIAVDTSYSVASIVEAIGSKLSLRNSEEYSLQLEIAPGVWLKSLMSLPEQVSTMEQIFVMKKKFFVHDFNVDQNDPMSLHLVYCQIKDEMFQGVHPMTKEEAISLASLHCQIQYGDFKPDLHLPGNLQTKEILPPQWQKKDVEKTVLSDWKKLAGMDENSARYRFVQLCRSMKTYGMTLFRVKEKHPQKKKLIDTFLGFTRDSIVRMELESKRVIKEHPFKYLLRWAASPDTFTLDFGAHEEDYIIVVTTEGEVISNLISGYIDLLMRNQYACGTTATESEDDDSEVADVSNVTKTTQIISTEAINRSQDFCDIEGVITAIEKMHCDIFHQLPPVIITRNPEHYRKEVESRSVVLQQLLEEMETLLVSENPTSFNQTAEYIVDALETLIFAARSAFSNGVDPDLSLLHAVRNVTDILKETFMVASNSDQYSIEELSSACQSVRVPLKKLEAIARQIESEDGLKELVRELTKLSVLRVEQLLQPMEIITETVFVDQKRNFDAVFNLFKNAYATFAFVTESMAFSPQNSSIEEVTQALDAASLNATQIARNTKVEASLLQEIGEAHVRLHSALRSLMEALKFQPNIKSVTQAREFLEMAQNTLHDAKAMLNIDVELSTIKSKSLELSNSTTKLTAACKNLISSNEISNRERVAIHMRAIVERMKILLIGVTALATSPHDKIVWRKVKKSAEDLVQSIETIIGETGRLVSISTLASSARHAAAATLGLIACSLDDVSVQLKDEAEIAFAAVGNLLLMLNQDGDRRNRRSGQAYEETVSNEELLITKCDEFASLVYKFVDLTKGASSIIVEEHKKQSLIAKSRHTANMIDLMLSNRGVLKTTIGEIEINLAFEGIRAVEEDLESAIALSEKGFLKPLKSKDEALNSFAVCVKNLALSAKEISTIAKNNREELGVPMRNTSLCIKNTVESIQHLVAATDDKTLQKALLNSTLAVVASMKNLMSICKMISPNDELDEDLNVKMLVKAGKSVAEAIARLTDSSRATVRKTAEEFQLQISSDVEKELKGCTQMIERCASTLNSTVIVVKKRAAEQEIDIDEQKITEAILEASQFIVRSTGDLIQAATLVQREVQNETRIVTSYKRDPMWTEGLISASKTVAGAVQHLLKAVNSAAKESASEEELIVAAQTVSSATAALVAASTVKVNPTHPSQIKLRDASSKVTQGTQQLVTAAKNATRFEELQNNRNEQYGLHEAKIVEMEKQMEVLRLERELEKARGELFQFRKNEYAKPSSIPCVGIQWNANKNTSQPTKTELQSKAPQ